MAEANKEILSNSSLNESGLADMAELERRLAVGDLPDDFLEVTEPGSAAAAAVVTGPEKSGEEKSAKSKNTATGLLVDIPCIDASNSVTDSAAQSDSAKPTAAEENCDKGQPLSTEETDRELALALQKQLDMEASGQPENAAALPAQVAGPGQMGVMPPSVIGRLTLTVVEARLARNYGMSRMDPYCRVRIGHSIYETPTCPNGAREPKWNKTVNVFVLKGTRNIDIEIYDECTFSNDAMIAHASIPIPRAVFEYLVVDEWFALSGQEGPEKEGMLHMILSLQPLRQGESAGGGVGERQRPPPNAEQLAELCKMFPNLDRDVVKTVFVEKAGDQEETVNALLAMAQE